MKRFKWWFTEAFSSLIVVVSFAIYHLLGPGVEEYLLEDNLLFYCGVASTIISFLGLLTCIFPQEHNVCRIESILIWILATCWSITAIVAIIGPYNSTSPLRNIQFSKHNFRRNRVFKSSISTANFSNTFLAFERN